MCKKRYNLGSRIYIIIHKCKDRFIPCSLRPRKLQKGKIGKQTCGTWWLSVTGLDFNDCHDRFVIVQDSDTVVTVRQKNIVKQGENSYSRTFLTGGRDKTWRHFLVITVFIHGLILTLANVIYFMDFKMFKEWMSVLF